MWWVGVVGVVGVGVVGGGVVVSGSAAQGLLGRLDGAPAWTLATHDADSLLDAALYLWRHVCGPLLAQLDDAPAHDPTRKPLAPRYPANAANAANAAANAAATAGASASHGSGGGFESHFAPGSVALSAPSGSAGAAAAPAASSHNGNGGDSHVVEGTPADPLDVNLLVRRCRAHAARKQAPPTTTALRFVFAPSVYLFRVRALNGGSVAFLL